MSYIGLFSLEGSNDVWNWITIMMIQLTISLDIIITNNSGYSAQFGSIPQDMDERSICIDRI